MKETFWRGEFRNSVKEEFEKFIKEKNLSIQLKRKTEEFIRAENLEIHY